MAAVRAALALGKPWLRSTGPKSVAGQRAVSANAIKHSLDTLATASALRYCAGVERALAEGILNLSSKNSRGRL